MANFISSPHGDDRRYLTGRLERLVSAAARDVERLDAGRHGPCSRMGMPAPAGRAPGGDGVRVRRPGDHHADAVAATPARAARSPVA